METSQIKSAISSIARAVAKLTKDVQACAVECLVHAVKHGDVTLADELIEACGKATRRASLRAWFEINGPFVILSGKSTFNLDTKRAKKLAAIPEAELRGAVEAKLWEEATPEPKVISVLDVSGAFDKFLEKIQKTANTEGVEVRDRELMHFVVTQVQAWHNEKAMREMVQMDPAQIEAMYGIAQPRVIANADAS
jgi:hypothetical protein